MTICQIDWSDFDHPLATLLTQVTNPLDQVTTLLLTDIWARGWSNFDHPRRHMADPLTHMRDPLTHMRDPLYHMRDPLTHMPTLCSHGKGVRGCSIIVHSRRRSLTSPAVAF